VEITQQLVSEYNALKPEDTVAWIEEKKKEKEARLKVTVSHMLASS
jgi:hypothetical protein